MDLSDCGGDPASAFHSESWNLVGNGTVIANDNRQNQITHLPGESFLLLSANANHQINTRYSDTLEGLADPVPPSLIADKGREPFPSLVLLAEPHALLMGLCSFPYAGTLPVALMMVCWPWGMLEVVAIGSPL